MIITIFFLQIFLVLYSKEECLKNSCNYEGQDYDGEQIEDDEEKPGPIGPGDNDISLEIDSVKTVLHNPPTAPP